MNYYLAKISVFAADKWVINYRLVKADDPYTAYDIAYTYATTLASTVNVDILPTLEANS